MNEPMTRHGSSRSTRPSGVYQDVTVHLDGTSEDEVRLAHAEAIAALGGGHLTGLQTNLLPDPVAYSAEFGVAAIADFEEQVRQEGVRVHRRLVQRFQRLGVRNDLRLIEKPSAVLGSAVAREARTADLFVATCPRDGGGRDSWRGLVEDVLFEGGHSVYLVPPGVEPRSSIRTILVGWTDTREATRAIHEALPLLRLASAVELCHVQEPARGRMGGAEAMADIARHLSRHGVETRLRIASEGRSVGSALLEAAARSGADLVVAGAYGHSRLREWIVGGTTRDLLEMSDVPILMAH
jgi:nucleotide-binding universal stress UspA family protein